ncbi:hypothetical protein ACR4XJ_06250 [Nitratidesulfovibrio sp. D1]|uniref:hypothetical protein n=1 Tax=Nitratidesulfovibrio sp. D1 TaxID=3440151 RepID=UPI003EBCCD83
MEDEAGYLAMLERQMDEAMARLADACRDEQGCAAPEADGAKQAARAACERAEQAARSTYEQEWAKVWGAVRQRKHKGGR